MKKVTAGRDYLGSFAPEFAAFNDDVLFGQVWSREDKLSPHDRSMITIAALMGAGITDESLRSHLEKGKENGITKEEITEIITQLAFYTGWPKGWAVFYMAMEIYGEEDDPISFISRFGEHEQYGDTEHFSGRTWIRDIQPFGTYSYYCTAIVFEPGCRNSWHVHPKEQTLFVLQGRGWYVEEGKEPRELHTGDIVHIPCGVRHWHGAAKDSWFEHIAVEDVSGDGEFVWLEPVSDEEYSKLP